MRRLGLDAVTALLVAIVLLIAMTGTVVAILALSTAQSSLRANCQQIEIVKTGLRMTLLEAERFAVSSPVRTAAEKQATVNFYADALGRLRSRKC